MADANVVMSEIELERARLALQVVVSERMLRGGFGEVRADLQLHRAADYLALRLVAELAASREGRLEVEVPVLGVRSALRAWLGHLLVSFGCWLSRRGRLLGTRRMLGEPMRRLGVRLLERVETRRIVIAARAALPGLVLPPGQDRIWLARAEGDLQPFRGAGDRGL